MSSLAEIRERVSETLKDVNNKIWSADAIDESIRKALDAYSGIDPLEMETVIDVLADGREVALNEVDGLLGVTEVWWPYDSAGTDWLPTSVIFRLWWDDARPVLFMPAVDGGQPQAGDEIRLWYYRSHTIAGLDGEAVTTVPASRESLLVIGAAGYAARSRGIDYADDGYPDRGMDYKKWSNDMLKDFMLGLRAESKSNMGSGMPSRGWH